VRIWIRSLKQALGWAGRNLRCNLQLGFLVCWDQQMSVSNPASDTPWQVFINGENMGMAFTHESSVEEAQRYSEDVEIIRERWGVPIIRQVYSIEHRRFVDLT